MRNINYFSITLFIFCLCIFTGLSAASAENSKQMGMEEITHVTISDDWILAEDATISGDLNISGSVDLNGHELIVIGNLNFRKGKLAVSGGELIVKGDLIQQTIELTEENITYGYSDTYFYMTNEKDYVFIEGNYINQSCNNHNGLLTAGTIEIRGDFRQLSLGNCFISTGTHKVLMSGDKKQNIFFSNFHNCHFNILEITNTSKEGINFETIVVVEGEYRNKNTPLENKNNVMLSFDAIEKSEGFVGDMETYKNIQLQKDVTINCNLSIVNDLDLNGKTFIVKGDLCLGSGRININGGKLIVQGDLRQQRKNISYDGRVDYSDSWAVLIMENDKDYLLINGNYIIDYTNYSLLTKGIMEIKGDINQISSLENSFISKGSHKVILSGDREQKINIKNWEYSCFNILQINNTSMEGVNFETKVCVDKEYINDKTPAKNEENIILSINSLSKNPQYNGDINILCDNVLQKSMDIKGDLTINGFLDLNGNNLVVEGNVFLSKGTLDVNRGKLIVKGNFYQKKKYLYPNGQSEYIGSCSILKMTNEEDYIMVNGDFITWNTNLIDYQNCLSAGTIEIKGDFEQRYSDSANFLCKDKHKVILSGSNKQKVIFEGYKCSYFNILEITNTSKEGVKFETKVMVNKDFINYNTPIENTGNIVIPLNALYRNPDFIAETYVIESCVVEKDIIVNGNLYIKDNLDLNGKTLTVEGDVYLTKGELLIKGGKLIVKGDVVQRERRLLENGIELLSGSYATIKMTNDKDYILIYGNFTTQCNYSFYEKYEAGVIEIKGDFNQITEGSSNTFKCSGQHKVILSGDKEQNVKFDYWKESCFNILEIKNTSQKGVNFESIINVDKEYINYKTPVINIKNLYLSINAIYNNSQKYNQRSILRDYTLEDDITVDGNLTVNKDLDLNGKTLTIKGDLYLGDRNLHINGGKLIVEGDFIQQYRLFEYDSIKYYASSAYLIMDNDADYVFVKGNFITESSNSHLGYLSAGTLEVKGDFTYKGYAEDSFACTGEHKVILSGDKKQYIDLGKSYKAYFNILEIKNTSVEGICLKTKVLVDREYVNINTPVENIGDFELSLNAIDTTDLPEERHILKKTVLMNDTTVKGDLYIENILDLNGKTLVVEGDVYLESMVLNLSKGKLIVKGNFIYQKRKISYDGIELVESEAALIMTNEEDHILVYGNMIVEKRSPYYGSMTAGTIEIKGDFKKTVIQQIFSSLTSINLYFQVIKDRV